MTPTRSYPVTVRRFRYLLLLIVLCATLAGCNGSGGAPDQVWGKSGSNDGLFLRPRAAAVHGDRLFIVDYSARIQVFDLNGKYVGPTWTTPDFRNGRPSGLGIGRDGNLIVCDSHYFCFRVYSPEGTELRKFGGQSGTEPGQLAYVSDVEQDADGFYYIAEFGQNNRISKWDADGAFVKCWGTSGTEPGQFQRARALAIGPDGLLYAADALNNRIQVFTLDGQLVRIFGEAGTGAGQLGYPYDLGFGPKGELYVVEHENNRVQKFTSEGVPLGTWGGPGREPGKLHNPWALAVDRKGRVHIIDTDNNRVQRVRF